MPESGTARLQRGREKPIYAVRRIAGAPTVGYEKPTSMPSRNGRCSGHAPIPNQNQPASGALRPLTSRELEVAELIARAKTNSQIGKILGCSPWTVKTHVEHILEKLEMDSRLEVGIWWVELRRDGGKSLLR
jgi:DNA-binding NarL/FixJ family response regulator